MQQVPSQLISWTISGGDRSFSATPWLMWEVRPLLRCVELEEILGKQAGLGELFISM